MKRFRQTGPGGQQTDNVFGRLVTTLTNARIATENNALYQTIFGLIKLTTKLDDDTKGAIKSIQAVLPPPTIPPTPVAPSTQTYLTFTNETVTLPNSRQLLAGVGIELDSSVVGQLTINTDLANAGFWTPLTDGDPDETDLIFASGECIMVFVPV